MTDWVVGEFPQHVLMPMVGLAFRSSAGRKQVPHGIPTAQMQAEPKGRRRSALAGMVLPVHQMRLTVIAPLNTAPSIVKWKIGVVGQNALLLVEVALMNGHVASHVLLTTMV